MMVDISPPSEQAAEILNFVEYVPPKERGKKPKESGRSKADNDIVTEDGTAQRFAELYRNRLRYCHSTGSWYVWSGSNWQPNRTGIAFQWARDLARELAITQPDKTRYVTSKTSFAGGVERFARSDVVFAVTMDAWDQNPFLLGTPDGTVDLHTGQLRASDPEEGITKLTAVGPGQQAQCPRWIAFLNEAANGDAELVRLLQQWCGYALTGDTREQSLMFVHGPGGNGKSVFLNVLTGILKDYATTAAMDTLTASKWDKHTTDLAMLRGARLVTASETEEGRAWAEARLKQMTGGDLISARFMRQDFFTFRPNFKLTIVGNHKPALKNVDEAMRRRLRIVPFIHKPAKPDRQLEERLKAEWPGILRWMIEGCLDWQANGLTNPKSVAEATETYFTEQDTFSQWLEECSCDPSNPRTIFKTAQSALFGSWKVFAINAGEDPGDAKAFKQHMQRKGFEYHRDNAMRGFKGVALRPRDYPNRTQE
jgi:putative DNA primase/helicase